MIERIAITDREQWLALRRQDVTASVVPALFSVHPYTSALDVYLEKKGVTKPQADNSILRRGRWFEGAVAEAVREQHPEWEIVKATEYLRDPELRLGATPDFYILGDPRGVGVLQTKTAAPHILKRDWADGEVPFWIALQNATELMLEERASWGAVAVLSIDAYDPKCFVCDVPRHPGVEGKIREAARKFWVDFEANKEPAPDPEKDGHLIPVLYPNETSGEIVDLAGDNLMPVMLAERATLKARMKVDAERCDVIETQIKFKIGEAAGAKLGNDWKISFKAQQTKEYTVAARTTRPLRITDKRPDVAE